ncbi:acetoacetate--CoA ligase [Shinella sedimenti]|uniref:Acetoacetate--CoA ligase n=1 Tax=Shinella sedimenti TaxID=2919913 RepID=A0ABT0CQ67_9HYPH|nr:acetoacetate--CoA ligase [Shinella sedimenti]MCJ8150756.1 acetoacetate--CoA ligase [Shinella sedimenti]
MSEDLLWAPSADRMKVSSLYQLMKRASAVADKPLTSYAALHDWSVEEPGLFWSLVWDFVGVIGEQGSRSLDDPGPIQAARFFPEASLNYAENLLRKRGTDDAIVFWGEDKVKQRLSWDELQALVSRLQQLLRAHGVGPGDRIAAMLPNMPETIAAMLAAASIGAVWSSCSPDFGEHGALDRFGQIEPKVFFAVDGYWYGGKKIDIRDKVAAIAERLPDLNATIVVDYLGSARKVVSMMRNGADLNTALAAFETRPVTFERLPFAHPLCILFSSGTTGIPKCIVHSAGGTLLQHVKEHRFHADIREGDKLFYFTTCGWMMWNWLATGLASNATLLLYDGSPFSPDGNILFDYADAEGMTFFGTSAKYIDTLRKSGLRPIDSHNLTTLRTISSTGSPLSPDGFRFVYDSIQSDVHLASISGGTDIVSCFVLGVPTEAVWAGEIQGPGLGMAVDVWDDEGNPIRVTKGELVCTKPFPSMPTAFWNDPDGIKYHAAYFERFENVWCHGDYAEWTKHEGLIIHGRSDTTLNPGGVRIGTAEIYNQVEQMPEIQESLCIGQEFDGDVRVILFVRMAGSNRLNERLVDTIRRKIRAGASPRHVPAKIIAVADIPRTKSGKITELTVRDIVHGRSVKNKDALANPEALDFFKNLPELQA